MYKTLLVFATVLSTALTQLSSQCCPPGQALLRRVNPHVCWDPVTNHTNSVWLKCNNSILVGQVQYDFYVSEANKLVIPLPNREGVENEPGTFCVGNATTLKDKNLTRTIMAAVVCYEETEKTIDDEVSGYCLLISAILLIITTVIYTALSELQDLQGKSIVNFCLSLGIGTGIMAGMKLVSYSDMDLCATRGCLVYFFLMASFFWMNAISVQILLSMRRPTISNYGWKEFSYYAIYAWGSAATLTIIMAIVNFTPGDHYKPGIGLNHCWFFNKRQQWYYMYSFMSILIAVNILIFMYITYHLWRSSFSSSNLKALRYKFMMTLRMSIVMGIAWIFEMIGSLAKSHIIWELLDIINSLQGVLIFLVLVVFRKRVIKCMYKRGWLDCVSGPVERYLAVGEDEEDVVEHTAGITLEDTKNKH